MDRPGPLVDHPVEFVSQLVQVLGRRGQGVDDLVIGLKPHAFGKGQHYMLNHASRVCALMRGAEEYEAASSLEDSPEAGLLVVTAGLSQHLLDEEAAEAVGHEQEGPRRISSALCLERDQEVAGVVIKRILADGPGKDMSYIGVVAVRENSSARQSVRQQVLRPE